ncbi:MAG: PTS fructose transporter subunit IIA, partial [Thioalkalispiraceae bacterium]
MSVGLLIITHGDIGQSIYDAAVHVMGSCPMRTRIISLHTDDDLDSLAKEASEAIIELDKGQGVLILTDMYGATPSNIACTSTNQTVEIVAGLNLPMLIRVLNYP